MVWFRKVKAGLVKSDIEEFIGEEGNIFFNVETGQLRLSDGVTPGGIPLNTGGGGGGSTYTLPPATATTLGGVKIGDNINVAADGTISVDTFSIANLLDVNLVNIQNNQTLIYNSSTNNFENTNINLIGGSENQILVKKSNSDYDYQWEDLNITLPTQVYTKLIDDVSTASTLYLGEALPESLENQPVWRVQRIIFDANGNVDEVRFAGTGAFDQVWTSRLSLTYT